MDVDNDPIDQNLLLQFTCLGTTDRDDLVKQFIELTGNRSNEMTASFFLEMNTWNLQNALCSFFDHETPRKPSSMELLESKLLPNFNMPPNTSFTMTWTVRNNGDDYWPHGCTLQYVDGGYTTSVKSIPVTALPPGATTTLLVNDVTPPEQGVYTSYWQMTTPFGAFAEHNTLSIFFQVDCDESEYKEETNLSEELASLMCLTDNAESRSSNPNANPFSVAAVMVEKKEQASDSDQNERDIS